MRANSSYSVEKRQGCDLPRPFVWPCACAHMSEYRLAEKPTLDALVALGYRLFSPEVAMTMRAEENRVILKPILIDALQVLNGVSQDDAEAIYGDVSILSDNEDWQRKLRGAYSRRL